MCGFAGFFPYKSEDGLSRLLDDMGSRIAHRGPDGSGAWYGDSVGLIHRRLAIQDLSPEGAQPMVSFSGRFIIAFNGEIYNFRELAEALEGLGVGFRGHSDTEVILAAFEKWGVESTLHRLSGMFAFALVDRHSRTLTLARDRMGEKPLYYGLQGNTLLFASELKAMKAHPAWSGDVDRRAITLLLRHNYIPAPHSIYRGIFKLEPGTLVHFQLDRPAVDPPQPIRYWKLEDWYRKPGSLMPREQRIDTLDQLLRKVIKRQMISDVPLGAMLSGGIDSSLVVSLMQAEASRPVKTFSIGFHEQGFNEAEHAKTVAQHLGCEHSELYVTPNDCLSVIPLLPTIYDEPFADSSQIPTFLVSHMARESVTVALSGDGGDELFCGYTRFVTTTNAWLRRRATSHNSLRKILERAALSLPTGLAAALVKGTVSGQRPLDLKTIVEKLQRRRRINDAKSLQAFYRELISYWSDDQKLVRGAVEPYSILADYAVSEVTEEAYHQLMLLDSLSYLPDDILVKVDRAAMACGLETRVPFLDHEVVAYAAQIPVREHLEQGVGKQLLRQLLYRYVPRSLVDRPKAGFAVPLGDWLRGPLRDWAEALLGEERLLREGYLEPAPIRQKWREHLRGTLDHSFQLWGILSFQAWLEAEVADQAAGSKTSGLAIPDLADQT